MAGGNGIFGQWQPRYAEAGIPTFPVRDKKPAVRGYLKTGPSLSQMLAGKFGNAPGLGFACKRAGLTADSDDRAHVFRSDAAQRSDLIARSWST